MAPGAPTDMEITQRVVRGWKMVDAAGQPVPSGEAKMDELLHAPMVRTAIASAHLAAMAAH